jgi:Cu/Ag efflux protein CusF
MIQTIAVPTSSGVPPAKENLMRIVQTISASAITIVLAMSTASAQQAIKGVVTAIDEPGGTISIQQTTSGTVGASGGAATDSYRVQDGLLFNAVHLGDKVAISVETLEGAKTITRLDKE